MRSPLPDSSHLEAGIVADTQPSRLSLVHDNVRDLLRRSVFGSVHSSPATSPHGIALPSPAIQSTPRHALRQEEPQSHSESATASPSDDVPGVLFPAWRHQPDLRPIDDHDRSATVGHPDLSPHALSTFLQQKGTRRHRKHQQQGWKRARSHRPKKSNSNVQKVICGVLGVAIIGLLGTCTQSHPRLRYHVGDTDSNTDIALATTNPDVSPILHVLFILSLLLASILFAHTLVRLCCLSTRSSKQRVVRIEPAPRRRRHRHQREGSDSTAPTASSHYVPPTPIAVHGPELGSEHGGVLPTQEMFQIGDKGVDMINPPPVYGSTTNSVRADPELLFWRAIPSPIEPSVPSPTYEEVARQGASEIGGGTDTGRAGARDREIVER